MTRFDITAVVTCYFEERSIDEFFRRLKQALDASGLRFEVILVNDGSTDGTLDRLRSIHEANTDVTVIDLFANSGQAAAMTAAIERARGENFLFIDSDLQLDPEDLPVLLEALSRGADVVSGVRAHRKDSALRRLPSRLLNGLLRRTSGTPITDFGCTFKIFRGPLLRAFELGPGQVFNPLVVIRKASRIREVPVNHHPRRYGRSGWTFRRLLDYAIDNVLGVSRGIFQYLSVIAFLIALLTFARIALAWTIPTSVLASQPTAGLLLNALLLVSSFLIGLLCLLGEYVVRIFDEHRAGPRYVVREVLFPRERNAGASEREPAAVEGEARR